MVLRNYVLLLLATSGAVSAQAVLKPAAEFKSFCMPGLDCGETHFNETHHANKTVESLPQMGVDARRRLRIPSIEIFPGGPKSPSVPTKDVINISINPVGFIAEKVKEKAIVVYKGFAKAANKAWHEVRDAVDEYEKCTAQWVHSLGNGGLSQCLSGGGSKTMCEIHFKDHFWEGFAAGCTLPSVTTKVHFEGDIAQMTAAIGGRTVVQKDIFKKQWLDSGLKDNLKIRAQADFEFEHKSWLSYKDPETFVQIPGVKFGFEGSLTTFAGAELAPTCPEANKLILNRGHETIVNEAIAAGPVPIHILIQAQVYLQARPMLMGRAEAKFKIGWPKIELLNSVRIPFNTPQQNRAWCKSAHFDQAKCNTLPGCIYTAHGICHGPRFHTNCDRLVVTEDGNCVETVGQEYTNNEHCTIQIEGSSVIDVHRFDVEAEGSCGYDSLTVMNRKYCGNYDPHGVIVTDGSTMVWRTDGSVTERGWKICMRDNSKKHLRDMVDVDRIRQQIRDNIKIQIEGSLEVTAALDLCVGVKLKVKVNGIGGTVDIPVCLEGSVSAGASVSLHGGKAWVGAALKLLPLTFPIHLGLPEAKDLVDTACGFATNALDGGPDDLLDFLPDCLTGAGCQRQLVNRMCRDAGNVAKDIDDLLWWTNTEINVIEGRTLWQGRVEMNFPWGLPTPTPPPSPEVSAAAFEFDGHCDHLEITNNGNCVETRVYGNNHRCRVRVKKAITLDVQKWSIEHHSSCAYDYLEIGGARHCVGSPHGQAVSPGIMVWHTDGSVTRDGWKICAAGAPAPAPAPVASAQPVSTRSCTHIGARFCANWPDAKQSSEHSASACQQACFDDDACTSGYHWSGGNICYHFGVVGSSAGSCGVLHEHFQTHGFTCEGRNRRRKEEPVDHVRRLLANTAQTTERRRGMPTSICHQRRAKIASANHKCQAMLDKPYDGVTACSECPARSDGTHVLESWTNMVESTFNIDEIAETESLLRDFDCTGGTKCKTTGRIDTCHSSDSRVTWERGSRKWYGCCNTSQQTWSFYHLEYITE